MLNKFFSIKWDGSMIELDKHCVEIVNEGLPVGGR